MSIRDLGDSDRQLDALDPDGALARRGIVAAALGHSGRLEELDAWLESQGQPRTQSTSSPFAAPSEVATPDDDDSNLEDLFDDTPPEPAEGRPISLGAPPASFLQASTGDGASEVALGEPLVTDLASALEPDLASALEPELVGGDDSEPEIESSHEDSVELDAEELAALDSLEILIDD